MNTHFKESFFLHFFLSIIFRLFNLIIKEFSQSKLWRFFLLMKIRVGIRKLNLIKEFVIFRRLVLAILFNKLFEEISVFDYIHTGMSFCYRWNKRHQMKRFISVALLFFCSSEICFVLINILFVNVTKQSILM